MLCQCPNETCHCKQVLSGYQQLYNSLLLMLYFKLLYHFVSFSKLFVLLVRCSNIHIYEGTTISLPGTQS